jgi:PAS domain S-box-containing protein
MPDQETNPILGRLRDDRIAPCAVDAAPAWLWNVEATRILWANATGAAAFGAPDCAALAARRFDPTHPAAAQIARLAAVLPHGAPPRLERLRGFGAGIGRALTCACSHIMLDDGTSAILVAAAESAGPALTLVERVRRLLAGCGDAVAVYSPDGAQLHAAPDAHECVGGATTLDALGIDALAGKALAEGHALGSSRFGAVTVDRLGREPASVLMVTFGDREPTADLSDPDAQTAAASQPDQSTSLPPQPVAAERRHPLRFLWHIDADGRFAFESDEFAALLGPRTAGAFGRPWDEVAAALALDPKGEVAGALASHETWSGITVPWPADDATERVNVELSGLPVFDRDRSLVGHRGFGVCRDLARMNALARARRATAHADAAERPHPPANVVSFRAGAAPAEAALPTLSAVEHKAFRELARELTARLRDSYRHPADARPAPTDTVPRRLVGAVTETARKPRHTARENQTADEATSDARSPADARTVFDSLPFGVLVYRRHIPLYANRAFLTLTADDSLAVFAESGGLDKIRIDPGVAASADDAGKPLVVTIDSADRPAAAGRLFDVWWDGERADMLMLAIIARDDRQLSTELALRRAEAESRDLGTILDTATDGVLVIGHDGRIVSCNRSAEALFGSEASELVARPFNELFAPESQRVAADYLDGLQRAGVASLLNDGREVIGRVRQGGLIPLFMTMGRIADEAPKFCAVFRDITQWKKAEEELLNAKRMAEKASSAKSEFLAKISHEIRTPLNAVIGFAEVMLSERFGPIGSERYREYLKDIRASGAHVVSLLNDLLDLSKIEAGKLDLTFTSVKLNELTQECVAIMQPQANRERIIIRTSLAPALPHIVADARSVRQIVLNLLSNSIKFTAAGGQVIVSTALSDAGEAVLRVRDTGIGMSEKDIATALEPFRQLATSIPGGSGGTGLGLPLTKALAEANRASFSITSAPNAGTLVEIAFPATRVLAE